MKISLSRKSMLWMQANRARSQVSPLDSHCSLMIGMAYWNIIRHLFIFIFLKNTLWNHAQFRIVGVKAMSGLR